MGMTEIAERATAARNALADLANSVAKLPPPVFNFARSIDLLGQLADWADTGRQRSGFGEGETLNRALLGTLEKGCDGREAAPMEPAREPEVSEAFAAEGLGDPGPSVRKKMAKLLGRVGGSKSTEKKIAAARANMQAINERRWGSKRKKPGSRPLVRRRR